MCVSTELAHTQEAFLDRNPRGTVVPRTKGERGMLVLLVVLLIPCALVSALVSCDESWLRSSSTAAFCLPSGCFSVAAAVGKKASVVRGGGKQRVPAAVTVRGK